MDITKALCITLGLCQTEIINIKGILSVQNLQTAAFLLLLIVGAVAAINIIIAPIRSLFMCRNEFHKQKPNTALMLSFFGGSGQHYRSKVYYNANILLFDKKTCPFSFAWLAYKLGNVENQSILLRFLLAIPYLPLAALGMAEMLLRGIVGFITLFVVNIALLLVLAVFDFIYWLLTLLFQLIDRITQPNQYCPEEYYTFQIPVLECPQCHTPHKDLHPDNTGLLWARCTCGKHLPTMFLTWRKKLKAYCPYCEKELASACEKTMNLVLIGGNKSGKTAYLAAVMNQFKNCVRHNAKHTSLKPRVFPSYIGRDLDIMYQNGFTVQSHSSRTQAVHLLYENNSSPYDKGIVIYEMPDEAIQNDAYERFPALFDYCDGLIVLIDPLSIPELKEQFKPYTLNPGLGKYSDDSAEQLIINFINKYLSITGRHASEKVSLPVTVLITKADLPPVKEKLGEDLFQMTYASSQRADNSAEQARNRRCRQFLFDAGLNNAINNLESVFPNVSYFAVSAIGGTAKHGDPFHPYSSLMQPIEKLAKESHNKGIQKILTTAKERRV